jgi:hypothetical protein
MSLLSAYRWQAGQKGPEGRRVVDEPRRTVPVWRGETIERHEAGDSFSPARLERSAS